nr:YciI family protein [Occallatibacter savannae]
MSPEERQIMQQHVGYWTDLMQKGTAIVFGPVMDPSGVYGIGVVHAESENQLRALIDGDPAKTINHYDYWPMRAVHSGLKG